MYYQDLKYYIWYHVDFFTEKFKLQNVQNMLKNKILKKNFNCPKMTFFTFNLRYANLIYY